ncbi:MAG TPA: hypothetical protein P5081_14050 [Phycisphaerae bacterium]|nr:hypothetical protein [Phycisphaerae bacterium]
MTRWTPVTKRKPCPACKKPDWCAWADDGALKCERSTGAPPGMRLVKPKDGGAIFRPVDDCGGSPRRSSRKPIRQDTRPPAPSAIDWNTESKRLTGQLADGALAELAATLGVSPDALRSIGVGWATTADLKRYRASGGDSWKAKRPSGACAFPERDGRGRIVGVSLRAPDGAKGSPKGDTGARRGLIVPTSLRNRAGPVLVVEGASDVAACETIQLRAVGRPSNTGGGEQLAELLDGVAVIVVGENDGKDGGAWPGRDGAKSIAKRLASEWREPVAWTLPPDGAKDIRAWLAQRLTAGLDTSNADACKAAGAELLATLKENAKESKPGKPPTQAELLIQLAQDEYRIGQSNDGEPFAVRRGGPNVALMLRGGRDAVRSELSRRYLATYQKVPSASALNDAMTALSGQAYHAEREPIHLRIVETDGRIVVDIGDADGRAIIIERGAWRVTGESPVLFRRTALTNELPEPLPGGDVAELRELLNVSDDSWPLLLGWLVAAFKPDIDHPILMIGGMAGSGKSTVGGILVTLFDPSPVPRRSQPKDIESWATAAAGSWGVMIDNVSAIPHWWSDALCKASTGDGHIRRKLYTDGDLAITQFRRVVAITSIDAGSLQGDLGSRLLLVELERIDETRRRSESALHSAFAERWPRILGALLDIVAPVMDLLESTEIPPSDRLADFSRILAAMDAVLGTNALDLYLGQRGQIAATIIDDDPVGAAIVQLVQSCGEWEGPAGELLKRITPEQAPPKWPRNACAMSGRLKRLAPALGAVGVDVITPRKTDKTRRYSLRRTAQTAQSASCDVQSRNDANGDERTAGDRRAVDAPDPPGPPDVPPESDASQCAADASDSTAAGGMGDSGDSIPEQSADELRDAYEERAAILEHEGGLSRDDAEAEARRLTGYIGTD